MVEAEAGLSTEDNVSGPESSVDTYRVMMYSTFQHEYKITPYCLGYNVSELASYKFPQTVIKLCK